MPTTTRRKPKIQAKIRKERDLEAHIRTQHVLGTEFVEMRDYIPSTETYSRGFVIERRQLPELIEQLQDLDRRLGGTHEGEQLEGQLQLDL